MNDETRTPEHDPVRRYLDGELETTDLPDSDRAEARDWDRLLAAVRLERPGAPAPAWLEDRIMAEIESLDTQGAFARAWRWLIEPRPVRVPPLAVGLATAAVVVLLALPGTEAGLGPSTQPSPSAIAEPVVYVQFVLEAPDARTVSVGGDFDGWAGSNALSDVDGDGIWTGRVALHPGVHAYMFLVDGDAWVTDPEAQRYADDGFGNRNALLALTDPRA